MIALKPTQRPWSRGSASTSDGISTGSWANPLLAPGAERPWPA